MDWNAFKELLKTSGKDAVNGAFAGSPLADVINNAPDLFNEAASSTPGQVAANAITGNPLTDIAQAPSAPVISSPDEIPAPDMAEPTIAPVAPKNEQITAPQSPVSAKTDSAPEAALLDTITSGGNDNQKRKDFEGTLSHNKLGDRISQMGADAADTLAGAASAFGGNVPGGAGVRETARQDKNSKEAKEGFEKNLRNDPNSDISKQYQGLLARFIKKDASDPSITGRSASQIAEQIPAIEKLSSMQNQQDMKKLQMEALKNQKDISLGLRNDQQQDKLEKDGRDMLNKITSVRSGGIGLEDQKVNQAVHLQNMLNAAWDPKTKTYNIPPSMHVELAIGLQRLLAGGGQTSTHLVDELRQKTAREGLAGALIYLGGDPNKIGGTTQSVSDFFAHAVERQGKTAQQLRDKYIEQIKSRMPTGLSEERKNYLVKQELGNNFSDYLPGGPMHQVSDGSKSANAGAASPAASNPSAPAAPTSKQLRGKTYIQKDGKWYKA